MELLHTYIVIGWVGLILMICGLLTEFGPFLYSPSVCRHKVISSMHGRAFLQGFCFFLAWDYDGVFVFMRRKLAYPFVGLVGRKQSFYHECSCI